MQLPHIARITLVAAVCGILLAACQEKTAQPADLGYTYVPVAVGSWYLYEVDSIDHNAFTGEIDTFRFQMREVYESELRSEEGRTTYRVERYKRNAAGEAWALTDVYSASLTNQGFERFEENQTFLRLTFPVKLGKRWDGHAYNNLGEQEYEYEAVDAATVIGGQSFDSTLTVVQENNINLIEIRVREEQYARNVGLVRRHITSLDLQESGGIEYTQELVDWGQ